MLKNYGKPGHIGNPTRMRLDHVQADRISFFHEPMAENFFEVAFFMNGKFVTDLIGEFANCAEPIAADTRVYRYVEKGVLDNFLEHHGVSRIR